MTEIREFFSRQDIKVLLREVQFQLRSLTVAPESSVTNLPAVLLSMANVANEWDKNTQYSIARHGDFFRNTLVQISNQLEFGQVEVLAGLAYIFVSELDLSVTDGLEDSLQLFKNTAANEFEGRSDRVGASVKYGLYHLPIALLKALLNSSVAGSLKTLDAVAEKIEQKSDHWEKSIDEREKKVLALQENLERQQYGYNFVGLYKGFAEMAETITKELHAQRKNMRIFGGLMLAPALVDIGLLATGKIDTQSLSLFAIGAWATLSITLTFVFLYFFRILLRDVDSKDAQLMQLRLRMTLCQFIQSYASYAAEMRQGGGDILAKFENIIFSGIVGNQDKLPSTFDGIEQLSGLIKTARGG